MADTDDSGGKAGGKGGLLGTLLLLPVAGAAGFGLVTLVPTGAPAAACEGAAPAAPEASAAAAYVALEPMVVALAPEAGARSLRIGLALGLTDGHGSVGEADALRLRDGFLDALRRVDAAAIADPDAMPTLRAALLSEARTVLGEGEVASLLVTDFVMR